MTTSNHQVPADRKLRILMLHGFTQSGHSFEIKTKALKKSLEKAFPTAPKPGHLKEYPGGLELVYPTAPIRLDPDDVVPNSSSAPGAGADVQKDGPSMERGFERIASVLQEHSTEPFAGVIGFSQGGAAAGMVASLLEPGRRHAFETAQAKGGMRYPDFFVKDTGYIEETVHPPMRFAVSYSGFSAAMANAGLYQAFYEPKIATPMLHVLGTVDTVVGEDRSLKLVESCVSGSGEGGKRVVYHPGGHFLPSSQKAYVAALVNFIRDVLGEDGGSGDAPAEGSKKEERAEDMDVPF
ncbi:hypothetical protein LTR48_002126 [Friedmanniomyces endolithicus]|uniref:Serine hydrolase domain-containing protein n=1 Tax=Rachicladosporium monterosium TaxID=1507873 RepID=A0ABR0LC00_9PEZI|nr:hypothetical protein LTR48_002126 [Friedmanniomyces endolithicus]KAK5146610.1 hypothetical protein LTR32_001825 [Rachicladosporium monterosium]